MADTFRVKVLKDGTVQLITGVISDANHLSAEEFLAGTHDKLGGELTAEANHERDQLGHVHDHDHHTHGH